MKMADHWISRRTALLLFLPRIRLLCAVVFALFGYCIVPHAALASLTSLPSNECDISNAPLVATNPCTTSLTGSNVVITDSTSATYLGARTIAGKSAQTAIDAYYKCRYIDSTSSSSLFIPFRTLAEWSSFIGAASNLSIAPITCARPTPVASPHWIVPAPPYGSIGCTNSNTLGVATPSVYARTGTVLAPESNPFTSCKGETNINSAVSWTALTSPDSNVATYDWNPTVNYGPNVTLTASPSQITMGSSATLTWVSSTSGATTTPAGQPFTVTTLITTAGISASGSWATPIPASGTASVSPSELGNNTYSITVMGANGQPSTATTTVTVVCPSTQMAWDGSCRNETYTAGGYSGVCPTGCGLSASTLPPTSCIRSPDGASVDPSYCSGAPCNATEACINGACGSANGTDDASAPTINLCSAGNPSATGNWTWDCNSPNGGTSISCSAYQELAGVCGAANGGNDTSAPSSNLCSVATSASSVSGSGPWSWTCSGINGGTSVTCSANLEANGKCGTSQYACTPGTAITKSDNGYTSTWTCQGINGGTTSSSCSSTDPSPACGTTTNSCINSNGGGNGSSGGYNFWFCLGSGAYVTYNGGNLGISGRGVECWAKQ